MPAPDGVCHEACEVSTPVDSTFAVSPPGRALPFTEAAGALEQADSAVPNVNSADSKRPFTSLCLRAISVLYVVGLAMSLRIAEATIPMPLSLF